MEEKKELESIANELGSAQTDQVIASETKVPSPPPTAPMTAPGAMPRLSQILNSYLFNWDDKLMLIDPFTEDVWEVDLEMPEPREDMKILAAGCKIAFAIQSLTTAVIFSLFAGRTLNFAHLESFRFLADAGRAKKLDEEKAEQFRISQGYPPRV